MANEFTLKNVVSDRICDPVTGWRDRLPEERIILNDAQKESFVVLFGKGCRQHTKGRLELYISDPYRHGLMANIPSWALERISWTGDQCHYCAGQDYPYEVNLIRRAIVK